MILKVKINLHANDSNVMWKNLDSVEPINGLEKFVVHLGWVHEIFKQMAQVI